MSEKLTARKLMRTKTRQEWLDYFIDREEKQFTRVEMAEELNTDTTNLRFIYEKCFGKQKRGRPRVERKFKGE